MTAKLLVVSSRRTVFLLRACLVCSVALFLDAGDAAGAAANGGTASQGNGGSKGGPGKAAPNPRIVYMSSGSFAPDKPAIRGVAFTISGDTVSSTDNQLAKALAGRDRASIVWSPDGARYAWIEGQTPESRKIMWGSPGKAPAVLYQPNDINDPYVGSGTDVLAWGGACSGGGSLLVFAREAKWDDTLQQEIEQSAIVGIDIDPATPPDEPPPDHGQPRPILEASGPSAFAISPAGHYLAFDVGYGTSERVSIVPLCESTPIPATLLAWEDFAAARYPYACNDNPGSDCPCDNDPAKVCHRYPSPSVHSIDWSGDGSRLALSVTVGTDPEYPWRDLRVAYLAWDGSVYTNDRVEHLVLDPFFGAASSEHSPQWGPAGPDNDCERLAFSQSAGASDGSTMNGRRLYLYDLVTTNSACFDGPREISARDPRAIDWK